MPLPRRDSYRRVLRGAPPYPEHEPRWYWPPYSHRAHFYRDGRSLCRRYNWQPTVTRPAPPPRHADACRACWDRRLREMSR